MHDVCVACFCLERKENQLDYCNAWITAMPRKGFTLHLTDTVYRNKL